MLAHLLSRARVRSRTCALALLLTLPLLACADKSFVGAHAVGRARLGVAVSLGDLVRDHEITAIRVSARYQAPTASVELGEVTTAYTEGENRTIALSIALDGCLRDLPSAAENGCPVAIRVEVLGVNRLLARDDLPIIFLKPGETAEPAALAARAATDVRVLLNGALAPASIAANTGATTQLVAQPVDATGVAIAGRTIAWSTSDATIATVSNSGLVTAVNGGTATISAAIGTGNAQVRGTVSFVVSGRQPASVLVTPSTLSLSVAATRQLVAAVRDAAGVDITPTPALTWTSNATSVATVDANGTVTAIAPGSATITARTASGVQGSSTVTVTPIAPVPATIQLTPATVGVPVGGTGTFAATVRDAAGAIISPTPALTWSSSATAIATVSATGVVTGVAAGSATITARAANGVIGTGLVTVAQSGSFSGRVLDFETNTGIRNANVSLFNGSQLVRSVTTDTSGNYTITPITGGPFDLRASATGYVEATLRTPAVDGNRVLDPLPLARTATGGGIIAGSLVNATSGQPIVTPSISLELYAGVGNTSTTIVGTASSNPNGGYAFTNIPAGTYTVVARGNGYVNASRTVVSFGAQRTAANQNVTLAPTGGAALLRIVLTWGETPSDLDSHLTGPVIGGTPLWIFYGVRGSCTQSPFACLDVDNVFGRGPETITITQAVTGRYVYSVHNYSAEIESVNDFGLARSNARVDVYGSGGLLQSFVVPSAGGTLWTVFEWDGATIRPINRMEGVEPPGRESTGARAVFAPTLPRKLNTPNR